MRAKSKTAPVLEGVRSTIRVTAGFLNWHRAGSREGFYPVLGAVLPIARTLGELNTDCGFIYAQSVLISIRIAHVCDDLSSKDSLAAKERKEHKEGFGPLRSLATNSVRLRRSRGRKYAG